MELFLFDRFNNKIKYNFETVFADNWNSWFYIFAKDLSRVNLKVIPFDRFLHRRKNDNFGKFPVKSKTPALLRNSEIKVILWVIIYDPKYQKDRMCLFRPISNSICSHLKERIYGIIFRLNRDFLYKKWIHNYQQIPL